MKNEKKNSAFILSKNETNISLTRISNHPTVRQAMLVIPTIAAIGAAGYIYSQQQGDAAPAQEKNKFAYNSEQREAMHSGFLRSANRAVAAIDSEEMRVIRKNGGDIDPRLNAAIWQDWFYRKNNKLGELYSWAAALDNQKILRYSYANKPGLLMLPNREGYQEFAALPNAMFDRESAAAPLDQRIDLYRDPFGNSGGAPLQGRSNVVLNQLYVGNAWGPGGQEFVAVGNEHRDPGYPDAKPTGDVKNSDRDAGFTSVEKLKRRVRFEQ
jgi:hypothetical protein